MFKGTATERASGAWLAASLLARATPVTPSYVIVLASLSAAARHRWRELLTGYPLSWVDTTRFGDTISDSASCFRSHTSLTLDTPGRGVCQ